MPEVSIITPVYNGERFIGEAIESVLAQTWQDWELIVVDDGSQDTTPHILERYKDPRIVCIRQDNAGEAKARNVGMDRARGKYIVFLDADDLYLPNALTDFVAYMDVHTDVDVAYSDGIMCDDTKNPLMRLSEIRYGTYVGNILEQVVLSSSVITFPVCTVTRRLSIEHCRARFDENLVIGPDWDFWIQLAKSSQFGYLEKLTCMYRVHQTNITRTSGQRKRTNDLVYGRMKVLNSDWFGALSLSTRQQFFYGLLIGLLSGDPLRQREILASSPFLDLPIPQQATLLRHVASDCLLKEGDARFAGECLEAAVNLWPKDHMSLILLKCLNVDGSLCRGLLNGWQFLHKVGVHVRAIGKRTPKSAPSALAPITDGSEEHIGA